ncbi:hypothetical protein [Sinorhizobium fredii]|uniref:hypothetical protein n=1 Tax=Rhizobium fredii TaxID=380 RepID=UPI003CC73231
MCRKQSGHVLAAVNVRRDALEVGGEQHVRWYRSSDKVERGFCSARRCSGSRQLKAMSSQLSPWVYSMVRPACISPNTHLWAKKATITKSQTVCRRATVTDCARFQGGCGRPGL